MRGLERYLGEVLDGKYRIEKLLGQGGMGAVFFAMHLGTERPVALKVIAPEFMRHDEFVERFKREARAAGRLRHPNVVDVTDFGFAQRGHERVAYLVMEYLDGCALADVLAEESRLPLEWVVDILEQVCSAVDEAHRQGIVHRDLKPDNIWLEPNRRGGYTIKVLDFGVAKLAEEQGTLGMPAPSETTPQANSSQAAAAAQPASRLTASSGAQIRAGEHSEASTLLAPRVIKEEAETRILAPPAKDEPQTGEPLNSEAATQIRPAAVDTGVEDKTMMLNRQTRPEPGVMSTASVESLTRVGSLLGTPLYMSPEQCRGEQLDSRSDIYSLGVIVYQMLAGETPFSGDLNTVMRLHQEAPPPPLRLKNNKVPAKVERLLNSAMAKDPAERPASAAAFASALRGNTEGVGSLLRRGFALYSEYFPKFLRISLLAHSPVILIQLLLLGFDIAQSRKLLSNAVVLTGALTLGLLSIIIHFLATSVITGMTVLMVMQLITAPLRPVQLREAFAVLKKRWRPFLSTSIRVSVRIVLGFILLFVPGLVLMVRYTLYAPVVLLEGLQKKAAMKRARELMRRSRWTVIKVVFLQIVIPIIITSIVTQFAIGSVRDKTAIMPKIYTRLIPLLNIFIVPLLSIMGALLYLKMRQIGGESLKDITEQLETGDRPRSLWQQRMRERLSLTTRISSSSSRH